MTTVVRPRPSRLLAALLGLVAAAALALGVGAGPAAAHEGDAVVVIEAVHPAGQSIHYVVRVTWEDDGHPAADATVTATAVAPDGTQLTPVTLAPADADGRYTGAIEYPAPGAWTVRVTSIDPTGTVEQPQEVTATATTAGPDVTTGSGAEAGFAPADDDTGASDADDQQAAADTDGSDGMPVAVIVIAGLVVVLGAVTALGIVRRVRANPPGGSGPTSGSPGAATGREPTGDPGPDPAAGGEPAASSTDPGRG